MEEEIQTALKILREGGTILYPTDTVWGLGCDPTNPEAVEKIFKIKTRCSNKSLIILVDSIATLERYVKRVPDTACKLIEVCTTPLTIIYPEGENLAPGVCHADGSIAIRICNEPFCNRLISLFRKPLVSSSANLSGQPAPSCFRDIDESIIASTDYVVNYRRGDTTATKPSSIIKINADNSFVIIRR